MTTNYHTPIPVGAAANAATFNVPLGQMDEALSEALLAERDGHIIQDEGVDLAQQPRLNFVGAGVTVTNDAGNNKTLVTIPRDGHNIEFEGSDITQRDDLNFTGDAVHVSDSGGKTVVDINHKMSDGDVGNHQISTSIASNNLTVALKEMSGSDPSTTSPVLFRSGNTKLKVTSALSITITAAMGDLFGWDAGKIQANDAQLFVYLINNNGTPQLGVSPCPMLTNVATNYYDLGAGAQTGSAGYTNIVMSGTRHANNSARVIGRINVHQLDNNNWQAPTTALVVNEPIWHTDRMNWTPQHTRAGGAYSNQPTLHYAYYWIDKLQLSWEERHQQHATPGSSGAQQLTAPYVSVTAKSGWGFNGVMAIGIYPLISAGTRTVSLYKTSDGSAECTASQNYFVSGAYLPQ